MNFGYVIDVIEMESFGMCWGYRGVEFDSMENIEWDGWDNLGCLEGIVGSGMNFDEVF